MAWKKKLSLFQGSHHFLLSKKLCKVIKFETCLKLSYKISINSLGFAVGCGDCHTVLMLDDGKLFSFGLNDYGQLGHAKSRTRPGNFKLNT